MEERFVNHKTADTPTKGCRALGSAAMKYGWENMTLKLIEKCPREKLNEREIYWISHYDTFRNGYNLTLGGAGVAKLWLPFEEARAFVRELGLKSVPGWKSWNRTEARPDNIPSAPNDVYKDQGWVGWGDWLGTGNKQHSGEWNVRRETWLPFEEARVYARGLGLTTQRAWRPPRRHPPGVPNSPSYVYKDHGWTNWGDFLGTGNIGIGQWLPFGELRTYAQTLGIKCGSGWKKYWKTHERPDNIPYHPERLEEWKGWADFLGVSTSPYTREHHYRSFAAARTFSRSLGLKSNGEWRAWCKSGKRPNDIPTNPGRVAQYKEQGWTGWGDWLGTGNIAGGKKQQWRSFGEARAHARGLGLANKKAWRKWSKSGARPPDIPGTPGTVYKDHGWVGLGDWLGTGNKANQDRQWRSFAAARTFTLSLGLKGVKAWCDWSKSGERSPDIPVRPDLVFKDQGWAGWGDWIGTGLGANGKKQWRSFAAVRTFARSLNIKKEYRWVKYWKTHEKPSDIPSHPDRTYKGKWVSWKDFLGN
jgi:hypothetical protein